MVMLNDWLASSHRWLLACTVIDAAAAMGFAVDGGGGGHHTGVDVDLEQPAGVTGQAVGDRVIGCVQVEGIGRQADGGSHDHVFVDSVGGDIAVGGR